MDRFALVAFWRSLVRHKLHAVLNIGGLALGIAVFLVLTLYVRFESGYERWITRSDQVYLIESRPPHDDNLTLRGRQATPIAAWTAISRDLPDTVGTRLRRPNATVMRDGLGIAEPAAMVDPAFFDVFPLNVVAGILPRRFDDPSAVVLTQRTATRYFGDGSPIGRVMSLELEGKRRNGHVVAVVEDLPDATDFSFTLIVPLVLTQDRADPEYNQHHQWNSLNVQTYVRLPDGADRTAFAAAIQQVADRHSVNESPEGSTQGFKLLATPLNDKHFQTPGVRLMVLTLAVTGLLTLILAVVNYVNLATARASLRAREVGMRKVLGADRAQLIRHYIGEAVVTALVAAIFGLALAELGVPLVNAAAGTKLSIRYVGGDGVLLPLAALALIVGFLSGIYPAIVLARVPAASVLASSRSPGGGRAGTRVREALVVVQFAITIALIAGTLVMSAQARHVRNADAGYTRAQLLLIRSFASESLDQSQRRGLLRALAQLPEARGVTMGESVPGEPFFTTGRNVPVPGRPGDGPLLGSYATMPGFFEVMGARLLAGRLFDPARAADVNANAQGFDADSKPMAVVLNRSGARALGFVDPAAAVGRTVGGDAPKQIIGVVEDLRFRSPREKVQPTYYSFRLDPLENGEGVIRFTGDPAAVTAKVKAVWEAQAPDVPFDTRTAVGALESLYRGDARMGDLFTIGSVLAVLIGCVGLWGLASFTTARRVREIGIRKTLGASSADVTRLLVGQFLKPVLLANLVAWPLAWFALRAWLAGFDDRIALSPLYFVGASIVAIVIAVATVLGQSLRASRATPAWALRHD